MSSSSARAQVEPLAALVAVFALGVGLSLYVGVLDSTVSTVTDEAGVTPAATAKLESEASSFGTIQPPIESAVETAKPDGRELNASLRTERLAWHGGPTRSGSMDCEARSVSVRTAPGRVRPGELEVCTWREP
jgi:hypothetical protein